MLAVLGQNPNLIIGCKVQLIDDGKNINIDENATVGDIFIGYNTNGTQSQIGVIGDKDLIKLLYLFEKDIEVVKDNDDDLVQLFHELINLAIIMESNYWLSVLLNALIKNDLSITNQKLISSALKQDWINQRNMHKLQKYRFQILD